MDEYTGRWKDRWISISIVADPLACSFVIETLRKTVLTNGTFVFRQKNGGKKLGLQIKNLSVKAEIMNPRL